MKFKKVISVLFIFGFLGIFGLCLPKECCKSEFKRNVEDIVKSYLKGQLNRKQLAVIYGDKLKEINIAQNQAIAMLEYDLGCYQVKMDYSDIQAKKDDVIPEYFWIYAKAGDEEALPLSVFFDLCGKEDYYEPRKAIPSASFKYIEGESPFRIRISVKDAFIIKKDLKKSSGRTIKLTRYPKSWDEEK
jgi:hypothetical protein